MIILSLLLSFNLYAKWGQPEVGPGSSEYAHSEVEVYVSGYQAGDFILYTPKDPIPQEAGVVAILHGVFQTNPVIMGKWIEHLVRKGSIVIFAKYQGPELHASNHQYMLEKGVEAINNAFNYLDNNQDLPQPVVGDFGLVGHSYGGSMVANYAVNYQAFNLPFPKFVFSLQPGNFPPTSLMNYGILIRILKCLQLLAITICL